MPRVYAFYCSYRLPIEYEDGERVNETVKVVTLTGGELLVESYITYSNVTETGEDKHRPKYEWTG